MKKYQICIIILILLFVEGCGTTSTESIPPAEKVLSLDNGLSSDAASSSDESPSSENTLSPEDLAKDAYSSFLSGDTSLFDSEQLRQWALEGWSDFLQSGLTYEYVYLDLDGDGINELLIRMENDPRSYNSVFHYANGRLFCWENDMVEMSSCNYPLQDGRMVSQYDYNGTHSYTIFRYLSNGEREELSCLFSREKSSSEDSDSPCPYYEIDGNEVSQTIFEEQLETLITQHLLSNSVWLPLL